MSKRAICESMVNTWRNWTFWWYPCYSYHVQRPNQIPIINPIIWMNSSDLTVTLLESGLDRGKPCPNDPFQVGEECEEYMLTYPEELWINCTITCPNDSHPWVDGIWTCPQIITKMVMLFEKTYSTVTLPFISHNWLFLWDYIFHKWCFVSTSNWYFGPEP